MSDFFDVIENCRVHYIEVASLDVKCSTKLLSDTPSSQDQFGSHQRVAEAIADLILSEGGDKCIGLEGCWGSGKSTVIELLKKELPSDTNKVLVIDAWAHEGDPLRRTVLERLINGLVDWIPDDQNDTWERKSNELACRIHESTKKSYPILADWAKRIPFLFAFLFPIGIAFVNEGIRKGLTIWRPGIPVAWEFYLGLSLMSSPLIPILNRYIIARKKFSNSTKQHEVVAFWSIFAQKYSTEECTSTITQSLLNHLSSTSS